MSVSFKNKILQYETAPPAGTWDKLSLQLDEDFFAGDSILSSRLENTFIEPPVAAWNNIIFALNKVEEKKVPARIIPIVSKRIAVAAVLLGAISLITVYLVNDNNNTDQPAVVVNNSPGPNLESFIPSDNQSHIGSAPKTLIAAVKSRKSSSRKSLASYASIALSEPEIDIADPKPVEKVKALEPVEVAAPPIRDARGNIIMNYAVITNPNEPYITVTSPNGNQTKISLKFLSCIKYLNSNFPSSEINYEEQQWKSRFQEWRDKISTATIVPAESNFFDIFELQELIQD